jgi:hypothetical protein
MSGFRRIAHRVGPFVLALVVVGFAAVGVRQWGKGGVSVYGRIGVIGVLLGLAWLLKRGLPKA